MMRSRRYK